MASFKALMILMFVAMMAKFSSVMAQAEAPAAPAPNTGFGTTLPVSTAVLASSVVLSLMALMKN
ncbi:hypothetical protein CASFOL_033899 [Castilleja foliolosa]|uniref:Uncharacterized protein n=1 Tax=Castilleja foliolosa TaxID=1961234 RepID=A0ABD3BZ48_9LAMI